MNSSGLKITDTQEKILGTFLEHRDTSIVSDGLSEKIRNPNKDYFMKTFFSNEKKKSSVIERFDPMIRGLTSYDLEKNKIPRRTWDINSKYLLDYELVVLIREEKKGKQLRKFYDITPIGMFTLLQKLDIETLEQDFLKKFSKQVPEISKHWASLEEKFGKTLFFILKRSLLQINWSHYRKPMEIDENGYSVPFGAALIEKTIFPFESESMELTLFRKYTDFTTAKGKQSRVEIGENIESVKIVIPTSIHLIDFDKISNNILKRLVFVFYYNLIRLHKEDIATVELAGWVWEHQEFEDWRKEARKDPSNAFKKRHNEQFEIARKIIKASKKTAVLIKKDAELKNMLKIGMNEIDSKFSKPRINNELLSEINS